MPKVTLIGAGRAVFARRLMTEFLDKARYALMLDPLTAAGCSLGEIEGLFEKMWDAERASRRAFD